MIIPFADYKACEYITRFIHKAHEYLGVALADHEEIIIRVFERQRGGVRRRYGLPEDEALFNEYYEAVGVR